MEEKTTVRAGIAEIPWTVGDIVKAIILVIALTLLIGFGMGLGTVLLIGPDILYGLGFQGITDFFNLLASEGLLQQWLLIALAAIAIGEGGMLGATWLFSDVKYKCGWRALGFRPFNLKRALIPVLVVLGAGVLINFFYEWLLSSLGADTTSGVDPIYVLLQEFTQTGAGLAGMTLIAVLLAPIAEETFLRGFIFAGIAKRFGYGWGALISALIFSVAHLQPGALLPIFILGLMLAWVYIRTGSIWPCILIHSAYNSIGILFMVI